MTTPRTIQTEVLVFLNEEELQDYLEDELNQKGITPDLSIRDARGIHCLAVRQAPGGDGCSFAYFSPGEDGFMVCSECSNESTDDTRARHAWKPLFPVTGLMNTQRDVSRAGLTSE